MILEMDTLFVIGLFIVVMAVPSIVSAWSDNEVPRVAAIVLILGGGMMVWAHTHKPGGYHFDEIPHLIYKLVAKII